MPSTPAPAAPADWQAVRALFAQLAPLPPDARARALADPALPPALRDEVASLLAHEEAAATGFLRQAPIADLVAAPATPPPARSGQRLGAWRLVRLLGAGGMGEVYEARRDDGRFQGIAAIKLLKRGMDSQAVLARFALEQQALARLQHPHIARLLDAGVSHDGQPYFVMEHVQGQPIDLACETLPLPQRLQLFLQLADAVSHAHRNLLVHRDLKPGNVLVAEGQGVKLLDFGIAKALDPLEGSPDGTRTGFATSAAERPFTPHYASPEQVRGEPVTTATDIYSLGVLLYRMLTGERPYGRQASTAAEAMKSVLDEPPTRPSSVTRPDPGWERTRRALQGDLDNILLKALAKLPAERYASVDAMAADIQACLDGRPVSARAASPGYVLAKWLGRHRAAAGAALLGGVGLVMGLAATLLQGRVVLALGGLGLAGGLVLALVQAQRAQQARDQAARARDEAQRHLVELRRLANSLVFEVNDALEQGLVQGRRQLVHAAAQSLQRQAAFGQLNDDERLELALALARLARVEGHEFTHNLGNVEGAAARYDEALQMLEPLALRQATNAAWHRAMAMVLEGRFAVLRTLREREAALQTLQRALPHATRAAALAPGDLQARVYECMLRGHLADHSYPVVRFQGLTRLDQARQCAQEALACSVRLVADHPEAAAAWRCHASMQRMTAGHLAISGRLADAVQAELAVGPTLARGMALPHGELLRLTDLVPMLIRRAITQRLAGRYDDAAATLAESMAAAEPALRDDPRDENRQRQYIATVQTTLCVQLHRGRWAEAVALHAAAHALLPAPELVGGNRHWQHQWMDTLLAVAVLASQGAGAADGVLQRLDRRLDDGRVHLRNDTTALDAELEANGHIAHCHAAALAGDAQQAAAAWDAAEERLQALVALRDPRDAVEAVRGWQLRVRLAAWPGPVLPRLQPLRQRAVARARAVQAALQAQGWLAAADAPEAHPETRWLAAQPP